MTLRWWKRFKKEDPMTFESKEDAALRERLRGRAAELAARIGEARVAGAPELARVKIAAHHPRPTSRAEVAILFATGYRSGGHDRAPDAQALAVGSFAIETLIVSGDVEADDSRVWLTTAGAARVEREREERRQRAEIEVRDREVARIRQARQFVADDTRAALSALGSEIVALSAAFGVPVETLGANGYLVPLVPPGQTLHQPHIAGARCVQCGSEGRIDMRRPESRPFPHAADCALVLA